MLALLGENWFYGDMAHIFINYGVPKSSATLAIAEDVERRCADTWELLTREQVAARILEFRDEQEKREC